MAIGSSPRTPPAADSTSQPRRLDSHKWKFPPVLGELVAQMLEGALDEVLWKETGVDSGYEGEAWIRHQIWNGGTWLIRLIRRRLGWAVWRGGFLER